MQKSPLKIEVVKGAKKWPWVTSENTTRFFSSTTTSTLKRKWHWQGRNQIQLTRVTALAKTGFNSLGNLRVYFTSCWDVRSILTADDGSCHNGPAFVIRVGLETCTKRDVTCLDFIFRFRRASSAPQPGIRFYPLSLFLPWRSTSGPEKWGISGQM